MKLLIVDDQQSIHVYLDKCLSWVELGFAQVLHALDSLEAIHLMERHRPELVILDIQMPGMNGLEVLEEMRQRRMDAVVIILSAYAEFTYAQTAIRYGVTEYLLKPIDRRDLRHTIDVCLEHIYRDIALKLRDTLLFSSSDTAFLQSLPFADVPWRGCMTNASAEEAFPDCGYAALAVPLPRHRTFLPLPDDMALSLKWARPVASNGMLAVSDRHIGMNASEIHSALAECEIAMESGLFFRVPDSKLVYAPDSSPSVEEFIDRLSLNGSIPSGQAGLATLRDASSGFFDALTSAHPSVECALATSAQFLQALLDLAHCNPSGLDIDSALAQSATVDELLVQFDKLLTYAYSEPLQRPVIRDSVIVELTRYLEANYLQDLSLDDLAKRFYVNKFDLCRRFKQQTGSSIWPYLTHLRIEHAKRLLSTTNMKIYEISEACCFNSPTYFSTIFKKLTGIAPQQWDRSEAPGVTP